MHGIKNYYGKKSSLITASPGTCEVCENMLTELLDEYKNPPDRCVVDKIRNLSCRCRKKFEHSMEAQKETDEEERLIDGYRYLAKKYGLSEAELECELKEMMKNLI